MITMEDKNLFKQFLEDEFTSSYTENSDFQIRTNISIISYWCNALAEVDDSECDFDFRIKVANNIIKQCCQLLKNPEIYANIFDAGQNRNMSMNTIELNKFFTDFCQKCESHLKDKCSIKLAKCDDAYIEGNEKFLNFIFLMYVRDALSQNSKKVDISFESADNYAVINLKINPEKTSNDMYCEVNAGNFNNHLNDIASFLIRKISGEISVENDIVKIKIPLSEGGTLRSGKPRFSKEPLFNVFNIMLADFDDFKYY